MIKWMLSFDDLVSKTRPAWLWVGQIAVAVLGVHLAADRLDDHVVRLLTATGFAWPEPAWPLTVATWLAVLLELGVVVWVVWTLLRAGAPQVYHWRGWLDRISVQAVLVAFAWLPIALAGAWVVGMAVEDWFAYWFPIAARPAGWAAALLVAARISVTGWWSNVRATPTPRRWSDGWPWAAPVILMALLAIRHGLPLWGWL